MSERRREIRLAVSPECSVSGGQGSGRILDVTSSGARLEMKTHCVFARGELHRLVLSGLSETFEVEGRVRWTRSEWRPAGHGQKNEYVQTAGFAFSRPLTGASSGILTSLLAETIPDADGPAPPAEQSVEPRRPPSPLRMITPVQGSTVSQRSTKVICAIEDPASIIGLRINGIDALIKDDLGTAEVHLQRGDNRIVSMISRRDGTYSTYLLGRVSRSPSH